MLPNLAKVSTQQFNPAPIPSANNSFGLPFQFQPQPHFLPPPPVHQLSTSQQYPQILALPAQPTTNQELLQKIEELSRRVDSVEDKSFYDNLMFAAIKEDQDDIANKNNLHKVTITGVQIKDFNRMAENEKPDAMKKAVNEIIALVTADEDKEDRKVVFVRHRNQHIRNAKTLVIETRFQEAKQATAFRKDFVKTVKSLVAESQLPDELSGLSTYPVQTIATRVRAKLLQAMANVVSQVSSPDITAYCQPFLTRPMMKIVTKHRDGSTTQSFGYVDSVMKLRTHNDLRRVALNDAYQLAGSNFRGRLEQNFVILKDH